MRCMDPALVAQLKEIGDIFRLSGFSLAVVALVFFRQPNVPVWKPFTTWQGDRHFTRGGNWLLGAAGVLFLFYFVLGFIRGFWGG